MADGYYLCAIKGYKYVRYIAGDQAYLCDPVTFCQHAELVGRDPTGLVEIIECGPVSQYSSFEEV